MPIISRYIIDIFVRSDFLIFEAMGGFVLPFSLKIYYSTDYGLYWFIIADFYCMILLSYYETWCEGIFEPYINGEMELRECTMKFRASYVSGEEAPTRNSCGFMR